MFKLRKRKLACDHKLFDIFFDTIETDNGEVIPDFLVVAPKNRSKELLTGVCILPIVDEKIGLLKVYRHATQTSTWEAPRGFVDAGESAATAGLRELKEETGLLCDPKNLLSAGITAPESGMVAARIALFIAKNCSQPSKAYQPTEMGHGAFQFFTPSEVDALIKNRELEEATTLINYYCYKNTLKK